MNYNNMVQRALRGVVRDILEQTANHGVSGNHHFYISFNTMHDGVNIPEYLRLQHPHEMTIVLQHQFWGLEVTAETFEVTLSFNKAHERLVIPFASVTAFADPSVQFGLQFPWEPSPQSGESEQVASAAPSHPNGTLPPADDRSASGQAADVVSLDSFRKKD